MNRTLIKGIGLFSMLLDHVGTLIVYPMYLNACVVDGVQYMEDSLPEKAQNLYPLYLLLRIIGRLAFPIFAFMIVEGFYYKIDTKLG